MGWSHWRLATEGAVRASRRSPPSGGAYMRGAFIEADRLCKRYGDVTALSELTFASRARILALVGPNGAGKTTFVKISTCLLKPSSGRLRVLGLDVQDESRSLKRRISLLPQDASPDSGCTPLEHVTYYLFSRGYGLGEARRRAREVLEEVGLWEHRDVQCLKLSGGMKRLVMLAMALAPEVDAIFLDEPTSGLDPVNKVKAWGLITRLAREGVHVLVTSHDMEEVEERAEEVVMINRGRLVTQGPPQELVSKVSGLACIEAALSRAQAREELLEALKGLDGVVRVCRLGATVMAYVDERRVAEVAGRVSEVGLDVRIRKCGLRDVFLLNVL